MLKVKVDRPKDLGKSTKDSQLEHKIKVDYVLLNLNVGRGQTTIWSETIK